MVDAHTHLYAALTLGMPVTDKPPLNFPEVLKRVWWRWDKALDDDDVFLSASAGSIASIKSGITTIFDHHASPLAVPDSLSRVAAAVEQIGLRACLAYEVSDRDGQASRDQGIAENYRFIREMGAKKHHLVRGLFGLHAVFTLSDETLRRCAERAVELQVGCHIHMAEHLAEVFKFADSHDQSIAEFLAAIIGGGPSSIGCAVVLRRLGHRVDLYERASTLGGLVLQVIPSFRLPHQVVAHDLARMEKAGITFHLGKEVNAEIAERFVREYDAIFLGIGLSGSKSISVPGMDLAGVTRALDFLRQARRSAISGSAPPRLGECIVVVGGGNVALDAAVVARRAGAERVIVLYRRTMEEMPAWRSEFLEATSLGVEFRWLSTITSIKGVDGKVHAVEVQPMRRTRVQTDGRRGVTPDPRSPCYDLPCDTVLLALGQSLDESLATSLGVSISAEGTIRVNPETFQTNEPKIFAAGEVVAGGSTVVASIAQGMAAGRAMHRWLSNQVRQDDT